MDELQQILGESDLLECCLGDDVAPTQQEADAQNHKVILKRRLRALKRENPELGKISLGRVLKAGVTGGVSELARTRVGKAIATGGMSEVARAVKKGKKAVQVAEHAAGKLLGGTKAAAEGALHAAASLPAIHINVTPCKPADTVASDVAKKVGPEMQRIHKLLAHMDVQNKATSEHNRIKRRNKFLKQVIKLLKQVQEKRCA